MPDNRHITATARSLAAETLLKWDISSRKRPSLDRLAEEILRKNRPLPPRDMALFHELVSGVVRNLTLLDWLIDPLLASKRLPSLVKIHLRLGAYQLYFLERVPAFAVVNAAVESIKSSRDRWATGLVNAVLRRLAEKRLEQGIAMSDFDELIEPVKILSIKTSHPVWLIERWLDRYGFERTERLCVWNNQRAPLTLRVNTLRATREEVIALFEDAGIKAKPGVYSDCAVMVSDYKGSPVSLPGWDKGLFQVQDEGAQIISRLLDPMPGETILDACAGLGGKTIHIANIMGDRGVIHAADTDCVRLSRLKEAKDRLKLSSITIIPCKNGRNPCMNYDRILVDAPCSGLGVIRRHPDIKWNRTPEGITALSSNQLYILEKVSTLLKPGGRLVYATCSQEPEETTGVITSFIERHQGWEIVPADAVLSGNALNFVGKDGFFATRPEPCGPDLFFGAVLKAPD
ncbi:MAG: 16S rRNA (cytosine(967)-C(5))-methyltransferase RsmB [Dissulfurimicrobium sp.]|uniref:16S rRNA (cytosine(967)-C(5))-methyltransferase RsmB n=1 Tax=Dissulfurimicrobium sp. TaxID=2022436 RepID=UPI004049459A